MRPKLGRNSSGNFARPRDHVHCMLPRDLGRLTMVFSKISNRALILAGAAGLSMAMVMLPAEEVRADDCLLDTNDDGNADSNVDTDLGADSSGVDA